MQSDRPRKQEWVFYGRWALVPSIMGISILGFVIVAGSKHAWLLWIAVPMMMVGLGYIFLINAIASLIAIGKSGEQHDADEEKKDAA